MRIFKNTDFKFMDSRTKGFIFSGILITLSVVSLILHGGPRFGIDFRGGTFLQVRFENVADPSAPVEIPIDEVRNVVNESGFANSEIKNYGLLSDVAIQLDVVEGEAADAAISGLYSALGEKFPQYKVVELARDSVGPKIGKELVWGAVISILVAMALILIYIMFRFELRFGVGAVAALFHDITITLGVFSVVDIEITVPIIAALLTIIGYSLNDTIVVFDRIRENMKTFKRNISGFADLVNRSINETLSRTVVTSFTTLMVVIVLYFFGGEVIKDFALALILGVIVGTYSSIFIASPIVVDWNKNATKPELSKKAKA